MQSAASLVGAETDLVRVKGEIQNIIAAVKQGLLHASMHEALTELEERNSTLEKEIAATRRGHGHHTLIAQMQIPNGRGSSQQRNRSKGRRSPPVPAGMGMVRPWPLL